METTLISRLVRNLFIEMSCIKKRKKLWIIGKRTKVGLGFLDLKFFSFLNLNHK